MCRFRNSEIAKDPNSQIFFDTEENDCCRCSNRNHIHPSEMEGIEVLNFLQQKLTSPVLYEYLRSTEKITHLSNELFIILDTLTDARVRMARAI